MSTLTELQKLQFNLYEDEHAASRISTRLDFLKDRISRTTKFDEFSSKLKGSISLERRKQIIQRIWMENDQFRTLRRNNEELQNALDEQNSQIVAIMEVYRRQTAKSDKSYKDGFNPEVYAKMAKKIEEQQSLIGAMKRTMEQAVREDEDIETTINSKLESLKIENSALREVLARKP